MESPRVTFGSLGVTWGHPGVTRGHPGVTHGSPGVSQITQGHIPGYPRGIRVSEKEIERLGANICREPASQSVRIADIELIRG